MSAPRSVVVNGGKPVGGAISWSGSPWPRWVWFATAAVLAADLVWIATPAASLTTDSWRLLAVAGLTAAGLVAAAHQFQLGVRTYTLVTGLAIALVFWPALKILNHLTMSIRFPLADSMLSGWDQSLGLDWLGYIRWLDSHPALVSAMGAVYGGLILYCAVIFVIVLFIRGHQRSVEFVCLFLGSAIFTIIVGAAFPAQGAMIFYAPAAEQFERVSVEMGIYFWEPLSQVRASDHVQLAIGNLPGLVAFPSFHTTMGVIAVYAARGGLALLLPAAALNFLMILSTPLFGGHYLVDIIAGIATGVGAVLVHRAARGRDRAPRRGAIRCPPLAASIA